MFINVLSGNIIGAGGVIVPASDILFRVDSDSYFDAISNYIRMVHKLRDIRLADFVFADALGYRYRAKVTYGPSNLKNVGIDIFPEPGIYEDFEF